MVNVVEDAALFCVKCFRPSDPNGDRSSNHDMTQFLEKTLTIFRIQYAMCACAIAATDVT